MRGARHGGIGAAKRVIGTELNDHRLGSVGDRPVEPVAAAGSGIAGHTRIDDIDLYPFVF